MVELPWFLLHIATADENKLHCMVSINALKPAYGSQPNSATDSL